MPKITNNVFLKWLATYLCDLGVTIILQCWKESHFISMTVCPHNRNKLLQLYSLSYFQFSLGLANILQLHRFKLFIDFNRLYKHFGNIAQWPRKSQINPRTSPDSFQRCCVECNQGNRIIFPCNVTKGIYFLLWDKDFFKVIQTTSKLMEKKAAKQTV